MQDNSIHNRLTLNCAGRLVVLENPLIMGILNTTPDSFHEASRTNLNNALEKAAEMVAEGVDILDIGAQSTRPGSVGVTASEEIDRAIPVIDAIHQQYPDLLLSIDTYYHSVALAAVTAGVSMVNDISAGLFYPEMLETVASLKVPYICMHMGGTEKQLHQRKPTDNITRTVFDFFIERMEACKKVGIHDIIIDPGFGFGNTLAENFQLMRDLEIFKSLGQPILLGVSRKSSIYKTLGGTAETALNGSTVLHTAGLLKGAQILRVHDVREAKEAIILTQLLK